MKIKIRSHFVRGIFFTPLCCLKKSLYEDIKKLSVERAKSIIDSRYHFYVIHILFFLAHFNRKEITCKIDFISNTLRFKI